MPKISFLLMHILVENIKGNLSISYGKAMGIMACRKEFVDSHAKITFIPLIFNCFELIMPIFNLQHVYQRRRYSRGRARGRGRNRGVDRGHGRGNRVRAFDNHSSSIPAANDNNSQAPVPRAVRGRGPRRYGHSLRKSSEGPASQNKQ